MHVTETPEGGYQMSASGTTAVNNATELLQQREKTKRMLLALTFSMFIVGSIIIIFSPKEKEIIAYILGGVMLVLSLGIIGAAQFKIGLGPLSIDTKQNQPLHHNPSPADSKTPTLSETAETYTES